MRSFKKNYEVIYNDSKYSRTNALSSFLSKFLASASTSSPIFTSPKAAYLTSGLGFCNKTLNIEVASCEYKLISL
jgi:hypothetical protein